MVKKAELNIEQGLPAEHVSNTGDASPSSAFESLKFGQK